MDYNYKNLICHKDNDPKNASLDNLYLGTYSDNMSQCRDEWRLKVPAYTGEKNPNSRLRNSDIPTILSMMKSGVSLSEVAKTFWVAKSTISDIYRGKTRKQFTSLLS